MNKLKELVYKLIEKIEEKPSYTIFIIIALGVLAMITSGGWIFANFLAIIAVFALLWEIIQWVKNWQKTKNSIYINITKAISILLLIACIIGGFYLGDEYQIVGYYRSKFNVPLMLCSWVIGLVSWTIMYGIACIVENTEK